MLSLEFHFTRLYHTVYSKHKKKRISKECGKISRNYIVLWKQLLKVTGSQKTLQLTTL